MNTAQKTGGHNDPVRASLVLLPNCTSENVKPTYLNTCCTAGKVQSHQHHVCPASQKSCLELFLGSEIYFVTAAEVSTHTYHDALSGNSMEGNLLEVIISMDWSDSLRKRGQLVVSLTD